MKRRFLVPVISAISALLGTQANANPVHFDRVDKDLPATETSNTIQQNAIFDTKPGARSEFSVLSNGDEYLFLMERSEQGVLTAYHSSHSSHGSHGSHGSHRSHYSSR